jgi:hypothetical protein
MAQRPACAAALCRAVPGMGCYSRKTIIFSKVIQFIDLCDRDDLFLVRGGVP